MENYGHISVNDAWQQLKRDDQQAILADIRDLGSFSQLRASGALHLHQGNLAEFCDNFEFDQPIFVICYHGVSSHNVAQFLANYGFDLVYSVDGGFAAWQQAGLPTEAEI